MRRNFGDREYIINSFNPRICKRCDKANALATRAIMVSIHASVKDATAVLYGNSLGTKVSIHASVKDATHNYKGKSSSMSSFNPRICKRCD